MTKLIRGMRNAFEIDGIIFDFDGTLAGLNIDFPPIYTRIFELSRRYGLNHQSLKEVYLIELIEEMAIVLGQEKGSSFYEEAIGIVVNEEVASAKRATLFDWARGLLKELKEMGIKTGLVTRNCEKAVLTVYPEAKEEVDVFLSRDYVKKIKPHPEHLIKAMCLLEIPRERAMMVGDHPIDIYSAREVEIVPVGVLTGKSGGDELIDAGAEMVLRTANEIIEYITKRDV